MRKYLLVALVSLASSAGCSFFDFDQLQRGLHSSAGDGGGGGGALSSADGGLPMGNTGGDPSAEGTGGSSAGAGGTPATSAGGPAGGGAANDGGSVFAPSGGESTGNGSTATGGAGGSNAPNGATGGDTATSGTGGATAAGGIDGSAGVETGGSVGIAGSGGSGGVPAETVAVLAAPGAGITIDGDLSEWGTEASVSLGPERFVPVGAMAALPADSTDFSAVFLLRWTVDTLYLGVTVVDDAHVNGSVPSAMWQEDSVQLALDLPSVDTTSAYDREFGWALSSDAMLLDYRWMPMGTGDIPFSYHIVRDAGTTVYEIGIPATELGVAELAPTIVITGSLAVAEVDDALDGRLGWLELTPGLVGEMKTPAQFLAFVLQ